MINKLHINAAAYLTGFCLLLFSMQSIAVKIAPLPEGLSVTISSVKQSFDRAEEAAVYVQFSNDSSQAITFLRWGTPFEQRLNADIFELRLFGGTALPYVGRMIKRAAPLASDYINLQAGERLQALVKIGDAYDLSAAGRYTISYIGNKNHRTGQQYKQSNPISFNVLHASAPKALKQTPNFSSCSSSEQTTLNLALTEAENISKVARDALINAPAADRPTAARYIEWFGEYTSARYAAVTENFKKLYAVSNAQVINFDCACDTTDFAFVYPDQPYDIFLCNSFWGAELTGTDSMAGTIVHELSHFTVIAGTDDHVYSQSSARALANSNPNLAIDNADNHEYFAENTPALSMPVAVVVPPVNGINIAPIYELLLLD